MIVRTMHIWMVTTLLWASAAQAQTPTVKDLFDNGQLHFDGGQYELAVEAWQAAYDQSQRPILLIKMADAREAQGELAAAIELLRTYRDQAEKVEVEPLNLHIETLQAQLVEPSPIPKPEPVVEPEPAPIPKPIVEPEPEPALAPVPTLFSTPVIVEGLLIGAAVSGLGVGAGFGLRAQAARSEAMAACSDGKGGLICTDSANDALARDKSASLAADIGFIVGGVAAAAATVNGVMLTQRTSARLIVTPFGAAIHITR